MSTRVFSLVLCALFSALVTLGIFFFLPNELSNQSTIVGTPYFWSINIDRIFYGYVLLLFFFPLFGMAVHSTLSRWIPSWMSASRKEFVPASFSPHSVSNQRLRTVVHVTVLAWGVASAFAPSSLPFGLAWVGLLLLGAEILLTRIASPSARVEARTQVAGLLACLTPWSLWCWSQSCRVWIPSLQEWAYHPWCPVWVPLVLSSYLLWRWGRASKRKADLHSLESQLFLYVTLSVLVFGLTTRLVPAPEDFDYLHEGEALATADLLLRGWFPWRDMFAIHGLLEDFIRPALSFKIFGPTRWSLETFFYLVWAPFAVVASHLLLVSIFSTRLVLTTWFTALAAVWFYPSSLGALPRLLPWFVLLLTLVWAHRKNSTLLYALTGALTVLCPILVPETAFAVPALAVGLLFVLRDQKIWRAGFAFTVGAGGTALTWLGYLASHQALEGFFLHFLTFGSDYRFLGGLPLTTLTSRDVPRLFLTVGSVLMSLWLIYDFWKSRVPLTSSRLVLIVSSVFCVFFLQKIVGRPDAPHVAQQWIAALPCVLILFSMVVEKFNETFSETFSSPLRRTSTLWFHLAIVLWGFLLLPSLRKHSLETTAETSSIPRLGYGKITKSLEEKLSALKNTLAEVMTPEDRLFDFTNQGGIYHYLFNYLPASRFTYAALATHQRTQHLVAQEIEQKQPKVVAVYADDGSWDSIANAVRHYDLSLYLLRHFRPWKQVGDVRLLLNPNALSTFPPPSLEWFQPKDGCDWKAVPHYLSSHLTDAEQSVPLPVKVVEFGSRWWLKMPEDFQSYDILEFEFDEINGASWSLGEVSKTAPSTQISFLTLPHSSAAPYRLQVASCLQWHGYRTQTLELRHFGGLSTIRSARLSRRRDFSLSARK